jgi:hypothetical protein
MRLFIHLLPIKKQRNKMKKTVFKSALVAFVALTMSGCASYSGSMLNSASLSSANFSYVKENISGTASVMSFLGLGGGFFKEDWGLVLEAKRKMLLANPLKKNQALVNITVNFKTKVALCIISKACTVTADVVEFKLVAF